MLFNFYILIFSNYLYILGSSPILLIFLVGTVKDSRAFFFFCTIYSFFLTYFYCIFSLNFLSSLQLQTGFLFFPYCLSIKTPYTFPCIISNTLQFLLVTHIRFLFTLNHLHYPLSVLFRAL